MGYIRMLRRKIGTDLLLAPSVTAVIRDAHDRVLFAHHRDTGVWVLPGGTIEPDERPADTLVREVWEETGLHVAPERLSGVFGGPEFRVTYANGDHVAYVMTLFECAILAGAPRPDRDEITDVAFLDESRAARLPLPRWARVVWPFVFNPTADTAYEPAAWQPETSDPRPPGE